MRNNDFAYRNDKKILESKNLDESIQLEYIV